MTLAGQPLSVLEIAAFISGIGCVWLTWRLHVVSWPVGLVNVTCFAVLFVQTKLYADAVLQGIFFVIGIYGWWAWSRARSRDALTVSCVGWRGTTFLLGIAGAGTWLVSHALIAWTDSPVPVPDAAILSLSLVATWAQARRYIESWLIWITVDVISVPLYWGRGLPLTACLYVLFLALCVAGLMGWWRRLGHQRGAV